MADDDFTADEDEYFETVLADDDAQKTYARFEKWKAKKHPPKAPTTPAPLIGSDPPQPPAEPPKAKSWTLDELETLTKNKPARSILRNLLDAADALEAEAAEAAKSAGLTNPENPKPKAPESKPKTPEPLKEAAKTLRRFI